MIIKSKDDLNYIKLVNDYKYECECEDCKIIFNLSGGILKKKEKILCKKCQVKFSKSKVSKEEQLKINEKRKQTNIKKFGVETPLISKESREKLKNVDWKKRNEKSKKTCLEKYGVENPILLEETQNKIKKNNKKKYGVEWTSQLKEVKDKQKKTCLEKYGAEYYFSSSTGKETIKKFWKENYNVENASQVEYVKEKLSKNNAMKNNEIKEKSMRNRENALNQKIGYTYNNIHFDSGWELAYFIYLIDNKISFIYHPNFTYKYLDDNGIERTYLPDFLVNGEFQEIKGNQFFNEKGEPYNQYKKEYWWNKFNFLKENNIKILRQKECQEFLKYIYNKYGQDYLKQFKNH